MPVLTCCSGMSRIATVVASAPEPQVVGIASSGLSGDGGLRPPPTGGFTYSMSSPPWVAIRSETLAVSMLDPPPIPTKPSKPPSTAKAAASANEESVGSTRARSHTSVSIPAASIDSCTRPVIPAAATPGSDDQHRSLHAEALELPARLGGGAGPVLERRRLEREDLLVRQRVPAVSRNRSRSNRFSRTSSRSSCSSSWTSLS